MTTRARSLFGNTRSVLIGLAALGSAGLLLTALGFQYIGGLSPCVLCIWQRWPHLVAVLLVPIALRVRGPWTAIAGAMAATASGAVAVFHTGVEKGWWGGLSSCAGNLSIKDMSPEEALAAIMTATPVRCDEVAWSLGGLSMASWNGLASIGLALVWIQAARVSK